MHSILLAIIVVSGIGALCAGVLSVVSKIMAVKEDARFAKIQAILPGANCGACGFPGCDGYATALLEESTKTNLCLLGGKKVAENLCIALDMPFESVQKQFAVVHCWGDMEANKRKMEYQGIHNCRAAKLLYGGSGMCTFGCLGMGDCIAVCPKQALHRGNGIICIDPQSCIGCGLCTKTCPNDLISLIPQKATVFVACSNTEKGALVREKCSHGCIACKKCEKECPVQAIRVENNLARIDYKKCTGCGHCVEVCPTRCIKQLI